MCCWHIHCQCPGGADGARRHVGVALYVIEDMTGKSATEGPPQWVQRSNACEERMKLAHVPSIRARYGTHRNQKLPSADVVSFDPRAVGDRQPPEAREAEFVEMLQKEVPDATVLEGLCLSAPVAAQQKGDDAGVLTLSVCCIERDMTLYGNPDLDFDWLVPCHGMM